MADPASSTAVRGGRDIGLGPLRVDSGCCNRLNWRCDVSGVVSTAAVGDRLTVDGFRTVARHPALHLFRHPAGHELAWVTTTGRMQIRVDLAVPGDQREAIARSLYRSICTAFEPCDGDRGSE